MIWNTADVNEDTASRVRTNLNAGQLVIIDTPDNKTLKLQCGDNAERLAIIDNNHFVAAGAGNSESRGPIECHHLGEAPRVQT